MSGYPYPLPLPLPLPLTLTLTLVLTLTLALAPLLTPTREWFHRMCGRGIGLVFAVPLVGFAARGMIPREVATLTLTKP